MFSKLGTIISTLLFGVKVGNDQFKNTYYNSKNDYKRWVMYYKENDASSVPPEWQAWLTKTSNDIPTNNSKKHKWQIQHTANNTGELNLAYKTNKNDNLYTAWSPNNKGVKIDKK